MTQKSATIHCATAQTKSKICVLEKGYPNTETTLSPIKLVNAVPSIMLKKAAILATMAWNER